MDRRGKIMAGSLRRKMGFAIDDGIFSNWVEAVNTNGVSRWLTMMLLWVKRRLVWMS